MKIFLFFQCFIYSFFLCAQQSSPIYFIYDASGSMWGQIDGKTKIEIASEVLGNTVKSIDDNQTIALVAYGHRYEKDCTDVEFVVNPTVDKAQLTRSIKSIKPLGRTPLAYSASFVLDKISNSGSSATIILITDGLESCDGNICDVVKEAKNKGVEFRMHIVGFDIKDADKTQLECAAEEASGKYMDASNAESLSEVLDYATSEKVDDPAGNVSMLAIKNNEKIDAWIKVFREGTLEFETSSRTYSDTALFYVPPGIYDFEIKPLAGSSVSPVKLPGIEIKPDENLFREVSFDSGQLIVSASNNGEPWDAVVNIYDHATGKRVAGGRTYSKSDEFDLNPGNYNVEIKILQLKGMDIVHVLENQSVEAKSTKSVSHEFSSATLKLGARSNGELVDVVLSIVDLGQNKNIAGGRTYTRPSSNPKTILINPGNYEVTAKGLAAHKGKVRSEKISVTKAQTLEIIFEF